MLIYWIKYSVVMFTRLLAAVVRDGEYGDDGGYVIDGFPVTAAQVYLF